VIRRISSTFQRHCQWHIERCYCRLKDFRRIATRYDKLVRNFFSSACLVAAVVYWM
jgi:transposase